MLEFGSGNGFGHSVHFTEDHNLVFTKNVEATIKEAVMENQERPDDKEYWWDLDRLPLVMCSLCYMVSYFVAMGEWRFPTSDEIHRQREFIPGLCPDHDEEYSLDGEFDG